MTDNAILDIHEPWAFQPDRCPCDVEFVEWFLQRHAGEGLQVFHMGPGDHHYVGTNIIADNRGDVVTALTLSTGEVMSYLRLVRKWSPALAARYQVIFGDLYQLDRRQLPRFDVGTLFHIGETNTVQPTDQQILGAILDTMNARRPGAAVLFYIGSSAWDRVEPVLQQCVDLSAGYLNLEETYKHLVIYR